MSNSLCLVTPTWAGDLLHFRLLHASLKRSPLSSCKHYVIAQSEDLDLFARFADATTEVVSSADVLPRDVERTRMAAQRRQQLLGRGGIRLMGSLRRRIGWPGWAGYTGWHTQQVTKLAVAAQSGFEHTVAIDSDVLVTRHAGACDFVADGRVVCLTRPAPVNSLGRKVSNWNWQAHALFQQQPISERMQESYFDTPFVFHGHTVRRMINHLEAQHACPWWRVLLKQPPRRWSEFATYRMFLYLHPPECGVRWVPDDAMRYLFDASDAEALCETVARLLDDPCSHYITIHSQSSGRGLWDPESYAHRILRLLDAQARQVATTTTGAGYSE